MTPTQRAAMQAALRLAESIARPTSRGSWNPTTIQLREHCDVLRAALVEPVMEPVGYVRMLNGEPTPDDDGCVFSYGKTPYQDTYGDEEWVPVSVVKPAQQDYEAVDALHMNMLKKEIQIADKIRNLKK